VFIRACKTRGGVRRVVDGARRAQDAKWKIKGPDGAAELMGVKPTTLLARMKKWGLKKPAA
jgi:hypothetical protein